MGRIDTLLAPESIAVVGASPDSWYASNLVENLHNYGYEGDVYYVNPSRDEIRDEVCYDSITEVPNAVDLAVVSVPRRYVIETVSDAGQMGIPSALVITAGFAEADDAGAELESRLEEVGEKYDMAICGPNTIGFANTHDETVVTSTCSRKPENGSIGLVSQSGALAFTTFYERGVDEDVDFAYIVATGNEAALTVTDYVDFMAEDDRVDVICAYIEGLENPRRFMKVASDAIRSGTPVLAIKVGESDVAEQATLSHTGSVTGDSAAWDVAFEQTGVERVPDIPDLLHRSSVHTAFDTPPSDSVCIASTSGGMASLLADVAAERDLSLPDIDSDTENALLERDDLLTFGELHNPIDIRGYGADILPEIAEILFADDRFDTYVFAIGLPAVGERAEAISADIRAVRELADDPVVFLWTGRKEPRSDDNPPFPYERVREETPLYYDPEDCMDAVASLVRFGGNAPKGCFDATPSKSVDCPELPADSILTWNEGERLLGAVEIEPVETRLATSAAAAKSHAESIGDRVVMKIDSRDVPHRTDADAVASGVTPSAAQDRYAELRENARAYAPDAEIEGVLVQEQGDLRAATEVLVGVTTEQGFGPVVTVAPGGEFVELFDDAGSTLIPPVDEETARDAIESSKVGELLDGYRGRPPGDIDALAELVSRISRLVIEGDEPRIEELDLNPVLVNPDGNGASIVDILVRTGSVN